MPPNNVFNFDRSFMQNFLAKKSLITGKRLTTGMVLLCSALAMIGCSRSEPEKKPEEKTQAVKQPDPINCQSSNASSSIQQALKNRIAQQTENTIYQIGEQAGLDTSETNLDNVELLLVNLHNVKSTGTAGECQATVAITMLDSDIKNANALFTRLQQPSLQERLLDKGFTLENNTIIAENQRFKLSNMGAGYQASSATADSLMYIVSDILANSQIQQVLAKNATVTEKTNKAPVKKAQTSSSEPEQRQAPRRATQAQDNDNNEEKPKPKPTPKPATNEDTAKEKPASQADKPTEDKPAEELKPQAEQPKNEAPANNDSSAESKPSSPTTDNDDGHRLTIEEKDEFY